MHDEGSLDRHARQRVRHQLRGFPAEGANQLVRGSGGVRQRPEHVEHGAHAHGTAHRHDGFHCRVVCGCEQECEVECLQRANTASGVQRQGHAELLQHVRAAGLAGYRAVAVFHDARARCGRKQTGAGGQVEAARTVAPGSHRVDSRRPVGNLRVDRKLTHCGREAANLFCRFALGAQCREQRPGQRRVHTAGRQVVHQAVRLRFTQCTAVQ